ncbi:MAG: YraN family protein [Burkholderiales bacterium]|jgi:putative endonuclease|nr:YraN family protein [Burkholderiales bacterium]
MGVATTYRAPLGYCCPLAAAAAACNNNEAFELVTKVTTKDVGDDGEALALEYMQRHGLTLLRRNYRVAQGPRARGGEVDLILRDREGTVVFVEVRKRKGTAFGGAAGSVTYSKQRSVVLAAHHFLRNCGTLPPCRFDVVAIEDGRIEWIKSAFDAM